MVAGVDEAGRGALAGPIVAAAVILNPRSKIIGVKDSKKLTALKRESLFDLISRNAASSAAGIVTAAEIDEIGIQAANLLALEIAVRNLTEEPDCVLADWYENDGFDVPWHAVKGGEAAHAAIAAASVIAKVTRDRIMIELHEEYPAYGFDGHKGYGSERHLKAIAAHGPCPIHRLSYEPCASNIASSRD